MLANLPVWVLANPGSVWVVGNEPDTTYEGQDGLLAQTYADRYYTVARTIRNLDPSALLAFGSVVQPTPIRLRYLDRAWNRLVSDAGSQAEASNMIDIWSIHSFILNEEPESWGTGVPPGFENDHNDAVIIDPEHFADTYSIDIFQQRVMAFRSWMVGKGERDKPLWITEYGSLFPPEDPPGGPNYVNVSDEETADFMLATFNFMLEATDTQTGLPGDGNQLVQRWFWYSLNEHRYTFGGSIYNPDYPDFGALITHVGEEFIDYQLLKLAEPDLSPTGLEIIPVSFNSERTLVNYRLEITIDNSIFDDASCAQVKIYDGNPLGEGTLIRDPIPSSAIKSYFGVGRLTTYWMNVEPLTSHTLYVLVEPIGVPDANPGNNEAVFTVFTELPEVLYFPAAHR